MISQGGMQNCLIIKNQIFNCKMKNGIPASKWPFIELDFFRLEEILLYYFTLFVYEYHFTNNKKGSKISTLFK